jgi:hypothetical protein
MVVRTQQEVSIKVGVGGERIPLHNEDLENGSVGFRGTVRGKDNLANLLTKVEVEYVMAPSQKEGTIQATVHRVNTKTGEVLDNYRAIFEKTSGGWELSAISGRAAHASVSSWNESIMEFAEKNKAWIDAEREKQRAANATFDVL